MASRKPQEVVNLYIYLFLFVGKNIESYGFVWLFHCFKTSEKLYSGYIQIFRGKNDGHCRAVWCFKLELPFPLLTMTRSLKIGSLLYKIYSSPKKCQRDKFCGNKIFFMLLFSICFPLPMTETTTLRVIIFNVYSGKTFMSPGGLISSVGTSFKTCKNLRKLKFARKEKEQATMPQRVKPKLYHLKERAS